MTHSPAAVSLLTAKCQPALNTLYTKCVSLNVVNGVDNTIFIYINQENNE